MYMQYEQNCRSALHLLQTRRSKLCKGGAAFVEDSATLSSCRHALSIDATQGHALHASSTGDSLAQWPALVTPTNTCSAHLLLKQSTQCARSLCHTYCITAALCCRAGALCAAALRGLVTYNTTARHGGRDLLYKSQA